MTWHEELRKIKGEEVSDSMTAAYCEKYIAWHRQAKLERIDWQKLEALADSGQVDPKKKKVEFEAGTKLLREYQGKTYQVLATSEGFFMRTPFIKA